MSNRKRLAVVDDDVVLARATKRILRDFEVDVFANGEDAYQEILRTPYDGVVCDVNMNGMSGPALLSLVANVSPRLASHFLFYTASVPPHDFKMFTVPVLLKPSMPAELIAAVMALFKT